VKRGRVGAHIAEIWKPIDTAKQIIGREVIFEIARIEQLVLIAAVVSIHLSKQSNPPVLPCK